ncbi:MAG: DUF4105 domain-containing protein [Roseobacter sp.]|uniref:Lnb N-terminal periplasmic domain-containing protein n=1 Tax=Tateyamaria sp. TaxID=1929288 RepID=UPI0032795819
MIRRILRSLFVTLIALVVVGFTAWGAAALSFRAPGSDLVQMLFSATFAVLGVSTLYFWLRRRRVKRLLPLVIASVALLMWWSTLQPPSEGNWSPDVARQVTGKIDGDILILNGVRNFEWRDDGSFVENWETRTYNINELKSTDLFLSYWAGPEIAHFILSFGFADGQYLAWSIEVRRQVDGGFSPVADAFKENPIIIVAATETDIVGLRTNIRQEDVQLFRLNSEPETARELLEEYVLDSNALAAEPHWYNSITTNCTTVVLKMMRAIGNAPPFDWRIIVNGYLPEYGYELGSLNTEYSIEELRELGSVSSKGQAFGIGPGYSEAIRQGVPDH